MVAWMRSALVAASVLGVARAATYNITTGVAGQCYLDPQRVNASAGDTVIFNFAPGAEHSVVQSRADAACVPLDGGWGSAHNALSASAPRNGIFLVNVSDTAPMFFYCALTTEATESGRQGVFDLAQLRPAAHCEQGMLGAINADDKSFGAYARTGISLSAFPDSGTLTASARFVLQTRQGRSTTGGIVGGVVGVLVVLACVCCCCSNATERTENGSDRARSPSTVTAAARAAPVDGLRDASPRDEELPAYEARGNDPPAPAPVPALAEGDVELQRLAGAPGVPASSAASALDGHGDALPTMPVPSDASPAMPPPAAARPAALDQAYPVVPT